jgi:glucosamine kinase
MMMRMAYYLGVDAGGTKTECALANDQRIVARATSGCIKPLRVTPEEAERNLRSVLEKIASQSGVSMQQIAATSVGTAGLRFPETRAQLGELFRLMVSGEVEICGDEEIALDAAFPGKHGVLVIAGTGSNTLGRLSNGETLTVGGWGQGIGDEGSGYWIGRRALNLACQAHDRDEPGMLLDKIIGFWGVTSLGAVVAHANQTPFPDFSALAPVVVECAEAGDAVSTQALVEAGNWLAASAVLAFRKVRRREPAATEAPGIALVGSILRHVRMVRETMFETVRRELPGVVILEEAVDAVEGAVWRARQLAAQVR